MPLKLHVFNPTPDRARVDFVVTRWQPIFDATGIHPEELVVRDSWGEVLPSQVDRVDPDDPSRDLLVFDLKRALPPGDEHYQTASDFVTIERGGAAVPCAGDLQVYVEEEGGTPTGFKLINGRLEAWFKLVPEPWADGRNWFAGSAYSVQLDRSEVLDAFPLGSWWGHDPEKRSMLVDYITYTQPGREAQPWPRFDLFTQRYRIVPRSIARGPVRAGLTIASQPFAYDYRDPQTGRTHRLTCELFRTLTLPRRVNFVKEDMFIKARRDGAAGGGQPVELVFTAHYFSYMQMGMMPRLFHLPSVPDWFAISSIFDPFQGYGFATNAHASPIQNPHPEFNDEPEEVAFRTFSWATLPHTDISALHLFWLRATEDARRPPNPESQAGHAWYEFIYKPLAARIK